MRFAGSVIARDYHEFAAENTIATDGARGGGGEGRPSFVVLAKAGTQ